MNRYSPDMEAGIRGAYGAPIPGVAGPAGTAILPRIKVVFRDWNEDRITGWVRQLREHCRTGVVHVWIRTEAGERTLPIERVEGVLPH